MNMLLIAISAILGSLWGISDNEWWIAPIILMPLVWAFAKDRLIAGLTLAVYVLIATRGFIDGSAMYFAMAKWQGILLWLAAASVWLVLGSICWFQSVKRRVLIGMPLWLALLSLPPFMIVGWANPLFATALLLPQNPIVQTSNGFTAHNTNFKIGTYGNKTTSLRYLQRHWQMQSQLDEKSTVDIYPESVGSFMDNFVLSHWQRQLVNYPHKTVLIGGFDWQGNQPQAVIFAITDKDKKIVYRQRVPMTAGMYNPIKSNGFIANWFGNSTADINGKKVGFAICFEYVTVFPIVQLALEKPDIIIAPTSIWWSPKQLQNAQIQSLKLAARLWQKPVLLSINGEK